MGGVNIGSEISYRKKRVGWFEIKAYLWFSDHIKDIWPQKGGSTQCVCPYYVFHLLQRKLNCQRDHE